MRNRAAPDFEQASHVGRGAILLDYGVEIGWSREPLALDGRRYTAAKYNAAPARAGRRSAHSGEPNSAVEILIKTVFQEVMVRVEVRKEAIERRVNIHLARN